MKDGGMNSGFSTIFILSKWNGGKLAHTNTFVTQVENTLGVSFRKICVKGIVSGDLLYLFLCCLPGLALKFDLLLNFHLILKNL
jgi:hypothetical protein